MASENYTPVSTSEHDSVFHIELQPGPESHGDAPAAQNGNGNSLRIETADDVIMRNSVSPRPSVVDALSPTAIAPRVKGQTSEDPDGPTPDGGPDAVDSMEVFSEETFTSLTSANQFQIRKMACQTLMDVALMMANISQLRTLISLGEPAVQYYRVLVGLVIASLVCQVLFAIFMFVIWIRESDQQQKHDFIGNLKQLEMSKGITVSDREQLRRSLAHRQEDFQHNLVTSRLNHVTMIQVFLITVINMFITGFGIKTQNDAN